MSPTIFSQEDVAAIRHDANNAALLAKMCMRSLRAELFDPAHQTLIDQTVEAVEVLDAKIKLLAQSRQDVSAC